MGRWKERERGKERLWKAAKVRTRVHGKVWRRGVGKQVDGRVAEINKCAEWRDGSGVDESVNEKMKKWRGQECRMER